MSFIVNLSIEKGFSRALNRFPALSFTQYYWFFIKIENNCIDSDRCSYWDPIDPLWAPDDPLKAHFDPPDAHIDPLDAPIVLLALMAPTGPPDTPIDPLKHPTDPL